MRTLVRFFFGAVTLFALGLAGNAGPADYPLIFVHEYCSDSRSWDTMFQNLPRRRYGDELIRLYRDADGAITVRGEPPGRDSQSFAIDFFDADHRTFLPSAVADISIRRKAAELKSAIDYIKTTTGHTRVIVVAHGMGGLVARAYAQGFATTPADVAIPYASDIADLITIGTPHAGADFAAVPGDWDASCAAADTVNRREMSATPGGILDALNRAGWPAGTRVDAIAAYYADPRSVDTDGFVTRSSQDVAAISNLWAQYPEVHVWSLPLPTSRVRGFESLAPHSAVIRTAATAALVDSIVNEITLTPAGAIRPADTRALPESAHPYPNSFDQSWFYTVPGSPGAIDVTFDPQTYVESQKDFLYVTDGAGTPVSGSPFTGDDLAGRTLRMQGSTVRIRLTSNETNRYYGFRVASANLAIGAAPPQLLPESIHPYTDSYFGEWTYVVGGNPTAVDVTFSSDTSVEQDYDFIYVLDANNNDISGSPFTGKSLAGRTVRVTGSTVTIILYADESVNDYGLRVTAITGIGGTSATPLTMTEAGPTIAQTAAAMIIGALEDAAAAAVVEQPAGYLTRVAEVFLPEVLYAQTNYIRNCPGGGSVRLERIVFSGGRYTLSNSSATFTGCTFNPGRRTGTMSGALTLNGAWCPGQSSCSGPGITNPSTPISTTGSLNVSDLGSVPFIGSVGSGSYSFNLGCSGCVFQGSPNAPPTPAANSCPVTVSPTSLSAVAAGGRFSVSISLSSTSCPWTASSNASFISVTPASGFGSGTVNVSVTANSGPERSGSFNVAGRIVTVNQAAGTTPPPGPTTLNVTGNWTVTDTSSSESGTVTLTQTGSSITGSWVLPPFPAGTTISTNRFTGSVSGSTVNLTYAMALRIEIDTFFMACSGTWNYVLQATNTRMTGPVTGRNECTTNLPEIPIPPVPPTSATATFTKQ